MRSRRSQRGFTLIELLVVVAIIAIIAAIATMTYLTAIQRTRQKKTVNDMRVIAGAWEARAADTQSYSAAGYDFPGEAVTYDELSARLEPTYARDLPRFDAWSSPYEFATGPNKTYAIRSGGRDKKFESSYTPGEITDFDCDIVYSDGRFVTFPVAVKTDTKAP